MKINDRDMRILYAGLTEFDTRMRRGRSNSGIEEKTLQVWCSGEHIHESYIHELKQKFDDYFSDGKYVYDMPSPNMFDDE